MIEALLSIIAVAELIKLVVAYTPATKKSHFKNKLNITKMKIWDLEFGVNKARAERESVRKEYDMLKARLDTVKTMIDNFPKDRDEGDKAKLEDDATRLKSQIEQKETDMKYIDAMIDGAKPSAENHEGTIGMIPQIESLKGVEMELKDWLKNI